MKRIRRIAILALAVSLLLSSAPAFAGSLQDTGTVLDSFLEPDCHAKPMTRLWFPDAAAGEDDNDSIEKLILELADKGFGGVEVAMLMSFGVQYTNEESRVYGWGTEKITDADFGIQPLGKWSEIQATEEILDALGVSDMKYVSGTGEYTVLLPRRRTGATIPGRSLRLNTARIRSAM